MENSFCSEYWPENQDSVYLLPQVPCYFPQIQCSHESFQERRESASRSHSEAEKRRRDRINAQLSTLRKLIPTSEKMDKAALLGSVVDHVKDLKGKTAEISKVLNIPTDTDEVTIEHLNEEEENKGCLLKASFCCDDRLELFSELQRGIKNLKLTVMGADITSLGGRIKGVFMLCPNQNSANDVCMNSLKRSLRVVFSRIAISPPSTSNYRIKSKRQRFFLPAHFS
ncbi:hypothetical protein H5410_016094 [Solanum commersonii]|uniref:BHLH domain-containing protein n=1 Tax=Solanum commersonii TaxID=4109 RepID=A0A9J5ZVH5_SOLCO|nr:hypothetical protein H5410_016094 [Solanum commersonii]